MFEISSFTIFFKLSMELYFKATHLSVEVLIDFKCDLQLI